MTNTIKVHYVGLSGAMIDGKLYDTTQIKTPGGLKINKTGTAPKVCRMLLEEGHHPETLIEFYRDGTKCFNASTLAKWADVAVTEPSQGQAKLIKYQPYTGPQAAESS